MACWGGRGHPCGDPDPLAPIHRPAARGDVGPLLQWLELPPPLQRLIAAHPKAGWRLKGPQAVLGEHVLFPDLDLTCTDCPDTCDFIHLGEYDRDGRRLPFRPAEAWVHVTVDPEAGLLDLLIRQRFETGPLGVVGWGPDWTIHAVEVDGAPVPYMHEDRALIVQTPGTVEVRGRALAGELIQADGDQVLLPVSALPGTDLAPTTVELAPLPGMTWDSPTSQKVRPGDLGLLVAWREPKPPQVRGPLRLHGVDERTADRLRPLAWMIEEPLPWLRSVGLKADPLDLYFWDLDNSVAHGSGVDDAFPAQPDQTFREAAATWFAITEDIRSRGYARARALRQDPGCFGLRSLHLDYAKHADGGALLLEMLADRIGRDAVVERLTRRLDGWEALLTSLDDDDARWLAAWLDAPAWPRLALVDGVLVDQADTGLAGEVELQWESGEVQVVAIGDRVQAPDDGGEVTIDPRSRFLAHG